MYYIHSLCVIVQAKCYKVYFNYCDALYSMQSYNFKLYLAIIPFKTLP